MEPCMPGCPSNADEHCDVLCPTSSKCNGASNTNSEHECFVCCCFPINLIAYIITIPCCICNMCCSKEIKTPDPNIRVYPIHDKPQPLYIQP